MRKQGTLGDLLWRYRGVGLVLLVPLILIAALVGLVPKNAPVPRPEHAKSIQELQNHPQAWQEQYSIVFDAGSTGSRIHVFKFGIPASTQAGGLRLIGDTFVQIKPGLSAYASHPPQAADSLKPLMDVALKTVPKELQKSTPISLKATAGLRLLPGKQADQILDAVRALFLRHPFLVAPGAVSILDGMEEGGYGWLTLNYLLGKLDAGPEVTVAAIDLGGGSVQEAFAMTEAERSLAPEGYSIKLRGGKSEYDVYVHSYLGFGLMAGRAKVISKGAGAAGHPCFMNGASGSYQYGGQSLTFQSQAAAANLGQCSTSSLHALGTDKACGGAATPKEQCTFDGVWRGPPRPQAAYYISSYFWDKAMEAGIIKDTKALSWAATPHDFIFKAASVCGAPDVASVLKANPGLSADQAPYLCLDLSLCHQLLLNGFKLQDSQAVTLVKQIQYNGQYIETSWALGAAIHGLSARGA